jgi:hypothetical protein
VAPQPGQHYYNVARVLFLLLARVAVTTYRTIIYFCAEKPEDPGRKIEFADSTPPLLRSLADQVFTVVFLGEDLPGRVAAYYRAGWREVAERDATYRARYGHDSAWREWLDRNSQLVASLKRDGGITEAEAGNPASAPYWPIPSRMKRVCSTTDAKIFLEYLEAWFYRELSQETHLSFPGLSARGGTYLRSRDDPIRESEWLKKRSDAVAVAVTLLLAFLTEVNFVLGFDLSPRCAFVWVILGQYFGVADELYTARYGALLDSATSS